MFWTRFTTWYRETLDADARAFWLGYALLLPFFLAPLFVTRYLPGLDMPFHLSMTDMLNKDSHPGSPYAPYYQGTLGLMPYGAHYLALRLFSLVLPLVDAHRVVIMAYVGGFPLAGAYLLNACGRSRIPALLTFLLAYNLTLHYGFVSFAISLPVLLLLLGALARVLFDERVGWRTCALAAGFAVLLFLCHLQNYLYGLCAAGAFIVFCLASWRRRLLAVATLVPSVAALLRWHLTASFEGDPSGQKKSFAFAWNALKGERLGDMGGHTVVEDLKQRLEYLPQHTLRGFTDWIDVQGSKALFTVIVAFIGLGMFATLLLPRRAPGRVIPRSRLLVAAWVAFLGALVAYFGLPHHLHVFELMTFYPRFSVLAVLMALVVIPGGLRRFDDIGAHLLLVPVVLLGGLYGEALVRHYGYYADEVADFRAVLKKTAPGGKALGVVFDRSSRVMRVESALVGLVNLYAAEKPALGSMVPLSYCGMRHMPCRHRVPAPPMPDPGPWAPGAFDAEQAVRFYDYIFIRLPPPGRQIFGTAWSKLELVAQKGSWLVYRRKGMPGPAATAARTP